MLEIARILAGVSVMLLIVAIAAWVSLIRLPRPQRLDGSAAGNVGHLHIAALLLLAAVGLSAVAALLAIAGWFAN